MLGISAAAGAVGFAAILLALLSGWPASEARVLAADTQPLYLAAYTAGAAFLLRRILHGGPGFRELWGLPVCRRDLVMAAGTGLSLAIAGNLLWYAVHGPHVDPSLLTVVPHAWAMVPQFAVTVAGVPFVEEVFYRGMLCRALRVRWGVAVAVAASAAVFTAAHVDAMRDDPWQAVPLYALGVCTGALAVRSGGLRTCYALHACYNAMALVAQWTVGSGQGA
ncbi:MAG: type II CAAX endopeptidase family protein [Candidatus Latescibacterota bacterium]